MDAAVIVAIIGGVVTLATFLISRRDKAKDPIPKQAAELAMAKDAVGIIKLSHDTLVVDVARMSSRLDDAEGEVHALRDEVHELRRQVQAIRLRWSTWYQDLSDRWVVHREQPAPPLPPTAEPGGP